MKATFKPPVPPKGEPHRARTIIAPKAKPNASRASRRFIAATCAASCLTFVATLGTIHTPQPVRTLIVARYVYDPIPPEAYAARAPILARDQAAIERDMRANEEKAHSVLASASADYFQPDIVSGKGKPVSGTRMVFGRVVKVKP